MLRKVVIALVILGLAAALLMSRRPKGTAVDITRVAKRETFRSYVTASGEIVAKQYADIGASVMGRVVSLNVKEGDRVRAGQVLARLDPVRAASDVEAAQAAVKALGEDLKAAEAKLVEAKLTAERNATLVAQGLLPKAQGDTSKAALDAASAQLDAIKRRTEQANAQLRGVRDSLSKTSVLAPIDGTVTRLQVREGEMVVIGLQNQPGTTLMRLVGTSGLNAELKVAEADALRLKVGQTARVTLDALQGREFAGVVSEIGASSLPPVSAQAASAREFRVVISLDQNDGTLRPGISCDAEILAAEKNGVLVAPLQAVVTRDVAGREETGVFLVRDGKAVFTRVTLGLISGLDAEIAGLTEGAELVLGPLAALRAMKDGEALRVTR
ncbi:MAG: efflux RND transporter periplasmic adaptor subunit [Vicinamibacteria bacterium]|nr:efflux RND transporter periplasmic adaptor subunit [Vicinamibacteria bacterium]